MSTKAVAQYALFIPLTSNDEARSAASKRVHGELLHTPAGRFSTRAFISTPYGYLYSESTIAERRGTTECTMESSLLAACPMYKDSRRHTDIEGREGAQLWLQKEHSRLREGGSDGNTVDLGG